MSTTDEIMELADAYATQMIHAHYRSTLDARAALLKAVEALVADAARYRWLRDNTVQTFTYCIFDDAAIDVARKEAP